MKERAIGSKFYYKKSYHVKCCLPIKRIWFRPSSQSGKKKFRRVIFCMKTKEKCSTTEAPHKAQTTIIYIRCVCPCVLSTLFFFSFSDTQYNICINYGHMNHSKKRFRKGKHTLIRSATQKFVTPWCFSERPPRTRVLAADLALSAVSAQIVLNCNTEQDCTSLTKQFK